MTREAEAIITSDPNVDHDRLAKHVEAPEANPTEWLPTPTAFTIGQWCTDGRPGGEGGVGAAAPAPDEGDQSLHDVAAALMATSVQLDSRVAVDPPLAESSPPQGDATCPPALKLAFDLLSAACEVESAASRLLPSVVASLRRSRARHACGSPRCGGSSSGPRAP